MSAPSLGEIKNQYNKLPPKIQNYYLDFPDLFKDFPYRITFSYLFFDMELAHINTLYCALAKGWKIDIELAWTAVNSQELFWASANNKKKDPNSYQEFFYRILEKKIPNRLDKRAEDIRKIRNEIFHGGENPPTAQIRQGIMNIILYANAFNEDIGKITGFEPFGSLRGFKGRAASHDKKTSRLILKGLGFDSVS